MNYKEGLKIMREMNVAGGAGGMFGAGGNQGGNVGNVDSYAPGDARVPKVLGSGGNDPYEYVNKGKKKKKGKKDKIPIYRRTFAETLTTESDENDDCILNCVIYTEDQSYKQVVIDIMKAHKINHLIDESCVVIEGTDAYIQSVLERIRGVITEDVFDSGDILALVGEMDLSRDKIPGGLSEDKTLEDFRKRYKDKGYPDVSDFEKQLNDKLQQGIKVEMEHTTDRSIAQEIAQDHIWEDFFYYDKLAKMEKK